MSSVVFDGAIYSKMISMGAGNLKIHSDEINNLNVFPIPDGDTGDNMLMTMTGGTNAIIPEEKNLSKVSEKISSGMLLGARGNSGVILSQFFFGISEGFKGLETADTKQLGEAFKKGVKCAYDAVTTPAEGTILTVAKDATNYACSVDAKEPVDFFNAFLKEAKESLERTPDLLPVLKKAGVVDSGGAGLIYIVKGMKKSLTGEQTDLAHTDDHTAVHSDEHSSSSQTHPQLDLDAFDEDSELEFGYCTELMLRLQNKKTNPQTFDVEIIRDFLNKNGNSVVAFKTGSIVKLHVHTMTPDKILAFCQQFGEFLTVKIENMSLQHNNLYKDDNTQDGQKQSSQEDDDKLETKVEAAAEERKPYGLVATASGSGIQQTFLDYGADFVVNGGQSMNPSAEDFIKAFDKVNADVIFVLPNNGNVILAAEQAAKIYKKSEIHVIESKTIGQGLAVVTMMDTESGNTQEIIEQLNDAMQGVETYSISHCVRATQMDGFQLKPGDYIGFCDKKIVSSADERKKAALNMVDKIDFTDHEACIFIRGVDSTEEEAAEIEAYLHQKNPSTEVYAINGGQEIYSYILVLE